jgi:hypothetical protein
MRMTTINQVVELNLVIGVVGHGYSFRSGEDLAGWGKLEN